MDRWQELDESLIGKLQFKGSKQISIEADCEILDQFKEYLLSDATSREVKSKYFYFLQRYLRDTQKLRCPGPAHYWTSDANDGKSHLEHPIPQNKILQAYVENKITATEAIHMPLCLITDSDKHILEGEWQYNATWQYPFKRYKLAGFNKEIKNLRGENIDLDLWSIQDHFKMLGVYK